MRSQLIASMLLWPLISGALLSNAQYSSPLLASTAVNQCESTRLIRCQQDVIRDMQTVSLNAASIQHPISGPPYSPKQQYQQQQQASHLLANPSTCRVVRSNLECLLATTPACYDLGIQTAQNTDIILRAKRFLEQNGCNDPDSTWQATFCFRGPEIRSCEERYGFSGFNSAPTISSLNSNNLTTCLAYQAFKYCVDSHLRLNCKVHEMDMLNEYLIDRASDLAWRCPANGTQLHQSANYVGHNPYQLSNSPGSALSPSSYSNYDRQRPTYVGSSAGGLFGAAASQEQPWERFRNPLDDPRYGISRYPNGAAGEVFDRLVATGNGFDVDTSDCPVKAAPYARECEDTLLDQQRLAKDARDGFELQRRICCGLYQYRDCISRVVLDRCADSSPTAVEILMGSRRREMTITCRSFNRDVCSGSSVIVPLNLLTLISVFVVTSLMALKQTQFSHR